MNRLIDWMARLGMVKHEAPTFKAVDVAQVRENIEVSGFHPPMVIGGGFEDCAPKSQRNKRSRSADSQAAVIARRLLTGERSSVQGFEAAMREQGMVSNNPLSRIKEAKKWLAKRGFPVMWEHVTTAGVKHRVWFIDFSDLQDGRKVFDARAWLDKHHTCGGK